MRTTFIPRLLLTAGCLFLLIADVRAGYLDAFIARTKQQHEFMPFANLWKKDKQAVPVVPKGSMLNIDPAVLAVLTTQKPIGLALLLGGYEIKLARYDIITSDFSVNEASAGISAAFAYKPGVYYRGVVKGIPHSLAAFSFFDGDVYGIFSLPGIGNMVVAQVKKGNSAGKYILYNDRDRPMPA